EQRGGQQTHVVRAGHHGAGEEADDEADEEGPEDVEHGELLRRADSHGSMPETIPADAGCWPELPLPIGPHPLATARKREVAAAPNGGPPSPARNWWLLCRADTPPQPTFLARRRATACARFSCARKAEPNFAA